MKRVFEKSLLGIAVAASLVACNSTKSVKQLQNDPLVKVAFQEKKEYSNSDKSVKISNKFDGARVSDLRVLNDSTFAIVIKAENTPINHSPWYAFKIENKRERNLYFHIEYDNVKHRYLPKYSQDNINWTPVDTVYTNEEKSLAKFSFKAKKGTTTVSAQELMTSSNNKEWVDKIAKLPNIEKFVIGKSMSGKPLYALKNTNGNSKNIVFVISRQHPPEVTGYLAMRAFVETAFGSTPAAQEFQKDFELVVVPMMNPDGVDNGHWRHGLGGVDLNRDWINFAFPETRSVRDYLENRRSAGDRVLFFLDFHSTWYDVFYTNKENPGSPMPEFTNNWLNRMEAAREGYKARIEPSGNTGTTSKAWFGREHQAESVTYEVGDLTPRNYISSIGELAAEQMMQLLKEYFNK